jgi:hypothetical protein
MKYYVHLHVNDVFIGRFVAVESAYFAVKPPERVAKVAKVLTTAQSYAQFLIMEKLDNPGSAGIDGIIRSVFGVKTCVNWLLGSCGFHTLPEAECACLTLGLEFIRWKPSLFEFELSLSICYAFYVVRICHRSLRRLPWTDAAEGIEDFIVKVVMRMVRKKYTSITNIADCLSGLHRSV